MKKRDKEELPDYTVADMDLEGMPWNTRKSWQRFHNPEQQNVRPMTKEERRSIIWLSLKAALAVALIFGGALFLFILFCVFVWLK